MDTIWGQGTIYNDSCPIDPGTGSRCITGCVATAMAQIVNYWEHPASLHFSSPADDYVSSSTSPPINIDGDASIRDFPSFPTLSSRLSSINYTGNGSNPADDTIADIMFACGVSVHMGYTSASSGTLTSNVASALRNKFNYDSAEVKDPDYDSDFYTILSGNMKSSYPAQLAVAKAGLSGGHSIVCDGFRDSDGAFHLNYGWDGVSDGWYSLPVSMPAGYNIVKYGVLNIHAAGGGDDNYEQNDTISTGWHPGYNWETTWLSNINGRGIQADDDWFKIDIGPAGYERVKVDCRFTHSAGDIDIGLYTSSWRLLDSGDSNTDNEFIDYVVSGPGTFYIKVYHGNTGNTYDLWWDDVPPFAGTITGRVTSSSTGGAIWGATVRVSGGSSTTTNSTGYYTLTNVIAGSPTVTVSKPGYNNSSKTVTVIANQTATANFALTLTPTTGAIKGRVTDSKTGAAIAGATVQAWGGPRTTTNGSGNYVLTNVRGGSNTVAVWKNGYYDTKKTVTVAAGGTVTANFTLTLKTATV